MATDRQLHANRTNARRSTGPRTAEGKAASAKNSTRHGLTARDLILSIEERSDYESLKADLIAEHEPHGTLELLMITQIADVFWRLRRARAIETGMLERELTDSATHEMALAATWEKVAHQLDLLRRYAAAFERSYFRSIAELRRLQAERRRTGRPSNPTVPYSPEPPRDHADPADYRSWRDIMASIRSEPAPPSPAAVSEPPTPYNPGEAPDQNPC